MEYAEFIRLVEVDYFGNVSANRQQAVLACFAADAVIQIRHGDRPVRVLKGKPAPGEEHLSEFWRHLNGNFSAQFTDFEHFVDLAANRCAATFTVTLTPHPGSAYFASGVQTLQNCNFFWLEAGLIQRMVVYYANPGAGEANQSSAAPTGYPPANKR
jgi:hypothetical protein